MNNSLKTLLITASLMATPMQYAMENNNEAGTSTAAPMHNTMAPKSDPENSIVLKTLNGDKFFDLQNVLDGKTELESANSDDKDLFRVMKNIHNNESTIVFHSYPTHENKLAYIQIIIESPDAQTALQYHREHNYSEDIHPTTAFYSIKVHEIWDQVVNGYINIHNSKYIEEIATGYQSEKRIKRGSIKTIVRAKKK